MFQDSGEQSRALGPSYAQNLCNPIGHVDIFGRDINSLKHLFGFAMCTALLFNVKL